MTIEIEFFGIPRQRAGVASARLELNALETNLGSVLQLLARQFPKLAEEPWQRGELGANVAANINGERFVRNPSETLRDGDQLLLLSAEAGV